MHVIAGCGVYLDRPHPAGLRARRTRRLVELFSAALDDGDRRTAAFRAGLLGLIGTAEPVTAAEHRVLRAAGAAAAATGAAVTVRLDPSERRGLGARRARAVGCPPEQVIFGNVDEFLDVAYLSRLAARGRDLEFCFGNEAYYRNGYKDPTDAERLAGLVAVLDAGLVDRCVLGCSVWTKTQLRAFGGMGYDHLLRRIVPELRGAAWCRRSSTRCWSRTPRGCSTVRDTSRVRVRVAVATGEAWLFTFASCASSPRGATTVAVPCSASGSEPSFSPQCSGVLLPATTVNNFRLPGTESQRAYDLLKDRFPQQSGDTASVVFAVKDGNVLAATHRPQIEKAIGENREVAGGPLRQRSVRAGRARLEGRPDHVRGDPVPPRRR